MCFSPQRRTIFQHLNFQKWSRTLSFLTFLLPNVLFATAACNFWCHLSAPTSAPAALTGLLLDWPDTRIYEKTQHFVTSLTFGADVSSFLLTFWLLHLLSTDLTTLLLLFNSPYCRKFLFKLPSINICILYYIYIIHILKTCSEYTSLGKLSHFVKWWQTPFNAYIRIGHTFGQRYTMKKYWPSKGANSYLVGGGFNPLEEYARQIGSFPQLSAVKIRKK